MHVGDVPERGHWYDADQMHAYALAAVEAYKASLQPVAWVDNDGFLNRAKDINTENALNWGWIPLFRLDDQP
jgi:hypothetical protein